MLEVDRSDRSRPRVTASVKQAMENPYEKALKKYVVGNRYVGTVSMVDLNGVFVSLDGGIDCLCTYPSAAARPGAPGQPCAFSGSTTKTTGFGASSPICPRLAEKRSEP